MSIRDIDGNPQNYLCKFAIDLSRLPKYRLFSKIRIPFFLIRFTLSYFSMKKTQAQQPAFQNFLLFLLKRFHYSSNFSDFVFGFQHFTPINPPTPATTTITANVKRYDNVILINSIKFAIKSDLSIC